MSSHIHGADVGKAAGKCFRIQGSFYSPRRGPAPWCEIETSCFVLLDSKRVQSAVMLQDATVNGGSPHTLTNGTSVDASVLLSMQKVSQIDVKELARPREFAIPRIGASSLIVLARMQDEFSKKPHRE